MVDQYNMTANFVLACVYNVSSRRSDLTYNTFISDIDLISALVVRSQRFKWGHCDYLLHLLLVGIRPEVVSRGASDILETIKELDKQSPLQESDGKTRVELLKDALTVAVRQPKPNKKDADNAYNVCAEKEKNKNTKWDLTTDDKQLNNCRRWAAKCASVVAERWEVVTEELKIWAEALSVPYDENMWQENVQKQKEQVPEENQKAPYDNTFVDLDHARQLFSRGRPKKSKNEIPSRLLGVQPSSLKPVQKKEKVQPDVIVNESGETWWSIPKIEKELNIKNFISKKAYYLRINPLEKSWFIRHFEKKNGFLYFSYSPEHFAKLESMFAPKKSKIAKEGPSDATNIAQAAPERDVIYTVSGNILWSIPKLENELNIPNFPIDEIKKKRKEWFEEKAGTCYFNSKYFEALKDLMSAKEKSDDENVSQKPVKVEKIPAATRKSNQEENKIISLDELIRMNQRLARNPQALRNKIIRCITTYSKQNPSDDIKNKVESWFIPSKKSAFGKFKSAHYPELVDFFNSCKKRKNKEIKNIPQEVSQVEIPEKPNQDAQGERVCLSEVAQMFGYKSREAFRRTIETCLARAPESEQQVVMSWFYKKGKSQFGELYSNYIENLRTFLDLYLKKKGKKVAEPDTDNNVTQIVDVVPVEEVLTDSKPESVPVPQIEETQQVEPAVSWGNEQTVAKTNVNVAPFGMADVKAVVAYLDHLMELINLAKNDHEAAEIEYQKAKEAYDTVNARLEALRQSFDEIKEAVVDYTKAELHLAEVIQNIPRKQL